MLSRSLPHASAAAPPAGPPGPSRSAAHRTRQSLRAIHLFLRLLLICFLLITFTCVSNPPPQVSLWRRVSDASPVTLLIWCYRIFLPKVCIFGWKTALRLLAAFSFSWIPSSFVPTLWILTSRVYESCLQCVCVCGNCRLFNLHKFPSESVQVGVANNPMIDKAGFSSSKNEHHPTIGSTGPPTLPSPLRPPHSPRHTDGSSNASELQPGLHRRKEKVTESIRVFFKGFGPILFFFVKKDFIRFLSTPQKAGLDFAKSPDLLKHRSLSNGMGDKTSKLEGC